MHLPPYIEIPLRLALLMGGLLLPGTMLLRALRLPWSLAAAFATSAATLYAIVLVFAWTGAVISLATLAAALGLVTLLARLVPARASRTPAGSSFAYFERMGGWLPLYAAFWLVVAYRLGFQPLTGPDATFRWSWLAEQMLQAGSLDFYPPRSGADFVRYFWAESIPPGVASLYAWAYACGGGTHPLWTSPVVGLQLLALHELVWRLASRWGGEVVARRAVLLAAACPLLTWSVLLGQETGLTALAVVGIVWCLHHLRDENGDRWAVLGGVFAIVAGGTREYGAIFPVVTLLALVWLRAPRRQVWLLASVALPVAAAWPVRAWVLTGNPVYSLNVAGLFPTNAIFTAWNDTLRGPHGLALGSLENWRALGRYFLLWAAPGVVGAGVLVALFLQGLKEARLLAGFVAVVFALWLVSVGYTAGGLFYSLRVLSPALALLAVAASYGLSLAQRPRAANYVAAGLALLLLESLPKTLLLPENPYRFPLRQWPEGANTIPVLAHAWDRELLAVLEPLPGKKRLVTDNVGLPRLFASTGIQVLPLWSPEIAWLFDETLAPADIAARWQKSGLRYFVLNKTGPTADFVMTHARWRAPYFEVRPVGQTSVHVVLEITASPEAPR